MEYRGYRGGGLVVTVHLTFYSKDRSLNSTEEHSFYLGKLFETEFGEWPLWLKIQVGGKLVDKDTKRKNSILWSHFRLYNSFILATF